MKIVEIIFVLIQLLNLTLISEQSVLVNSNLLTNTIQCDFENGFCPGWTDFMLASFNWTIGTGTTPTSFTGPDYDHTLGENGEGKYVYVEATGNSNSEAWLKTPNFILDESRKKEVCIQFWYYLYGEDVGKILVGVIVPGRGRVILDSVFGNHGKEWMQKNVSMTETVPDFQVFFFAEIKNGSKGDMAIDDVSIIQGECPLVCKSDQFTCEISRKCIDKEMVCDGIEDCQAASEDEVNCEERCTDGVYCSGICLPFTKVCDGVFDCLKGEDEVKCSVEECDEDQFLCPVDEYGGVICIDFDHICDSVSDCPYGEDERFCEMEFTSTTTKPTTIESTTTTTTEAPESTTTKTTASESTITIAPESTTTTTEASEPPTTTGASEPTTTTEVPEPPTTTGAPEPSPTTTGAAEPTTTTGASEPPTTTGAPEPPTTTGASEPTTTTGAPEPPPTTTGASEPTTTGASEPPTTGAPEPPTTTGASEPTTGASEPTTTTGASEPPTTTTGASEPPTTTAKGGAKVYLPSAISIFFFIFYILIALNN